MNTLALQFFDVSGKTLDELDEIANKETDSMAGEPLLCGVCRHIITTDVERISVQSSHSHTCTNPGGIVFDIACFRHAPGCSSIGAATAEHTWFSGYQWQIAVCGSCGEHLGWLFRDGDSFYGLIIARLTSN